MAREKRCAFCLELIDYIGYHNKQHHDLHMSFYQGCGTVGMWAAMSIRINNKWQIFNQGRSCAYKT